MPRKRVTAKVASISACTGGWNARDPIAGMPETDAVTLINMLPAPSDVRLRLGWQLQGNVTGGRVETIMTYAGGNVEKLFAITEDGIWDCTTRGAPVLIPNFSIVDPSFEWVMFSNDAGNFLVAVNGPDPMIIYDGTTWFKVADGALTPQTISSAVVAGTTLTITTAQPHGLITANRITLSGFTPSAYNGVYAVNVTGANTFTVTVVNTGAVTTTGVYAISQITGVDTRNLYNINVFKNRLWFVLKNTLTAYYLDTQAIFGTAFPFPLGAFFSGGGYLQAIGTWTLDAGQGVDDLLVFVSSSGEILVYQGADPSDATGFAMRGLWQLGTVFTKRCFYKWGGDLLLLTHEGLSPLAQSLQSSRLDPRVNLTDKIYYAISQAADMFQNNIGWQITYFGRQNLLIINIPTNGTASNEQYVMHTINKSWCRFTNIDAICYTIFEDNLYYGGINVVGQYYIGNSDNGNNITAQVQQAFSYFNSPGQLKRFTLARPTYLVDVATPGIAIGINTDFDVDSVLAPPAFDPNLAFVGQWDVSLWDDFAIFASEQYIVNTVWQGVTGIGISAGLTMNLTAQGSNVRWISTDYAFEPGGVL